MSRIILHVDLDAFYASLEKKRNPELAGKPVVVCMITTRGGGAVATASYEARALGIMSGMYLNEAQQHANAETVFLPADKPFYQAESGEIMALLRSYADAFQQVSIDEAYLDISQRCKDYEDAAMLAEKIKSLIIGKVGITCSVGIGRNKLVAKMASGFRKPDGLTVIVDDKTREFLDPMPVKKLHGVGPKTVAALAEHGIITAKDLAEKSIEFLSGIFGKNKGLLLYNKAKGIDESTVEDTEKKQLSRITTLPRNTSSLEEIMAALHPMLEDLDKKIAEKNVSFRTISIIAISASLETRTKSLTLSAPEANASKLALLFSQLFREFLHGERAILRRCGVRVSNFVEKEKKQKSLGEF